MAFVDDVNRLADTVAEIRDLLRELSVLVKEREEIRNESSSQVYLTSRQAPLRNRPKRL